MKSKSIFVDWKPIKIKRDKDGLPLNPTWKVVSIKKLYKFWNPSK